MERMEPTSADASASITPNVQEDASAAAAATAGDRDAFGALAARYQNELRVHCYRMVASYDDAAEAGQKGSPAYFTGTFSADDSTLDGAWVYPGGGGYSSTATRIG